MTGNEEELPTEYVTMHSAAHVEARLEHRKMLQSQAVLRCALLTRSASQPTPSTSRQTSSRSLLRCSQTTNEVVPLSRMTSQGNGQRKRKRNEQVVDDGGIVGKRL